MASATEDVDTRKIPLKQCQCSCCDELFTEGNITSIAKSVAEHWNGSHGDILKESYTAFEEIEAERHHITGDQYQVRQKKYFITSYDILSSDAENPLNKRFIRQPQYKKVCEDCWASLDEVENYTKIGSNNGRDRHLCLPCERRRKIKRREKQNQQLDRFEDG